MQFFYKHLLKSANRIDCRILALFQKCHGKVAFFYEPFYISRDCISPKRALDFVGSVVLFSSLIIFNIIPF